MKQLHCQFIGSFFKLDQLPKDDRLQIAFAGRSNVGKSTLINKLTGQKKLAKVAKTPGKTRSINFYLADNRFYFVDLPGYGYARASKKERAGWGKLIEDYFENNYLLAGLILLLDCRREATDDDLQLIDWISKKKLPAIAVITKADKLNRDKLNRKVKEIETSFSLKAIPFSVITGVGKKEILRAVFELVSRNN